MTGKTHTSKPGPKLTANQRAGIVALVMHGHSQANVARQFKVSPQTVKMLCRSTLSAARALTDDWREKQAALGVLAVNRAMLDESDSYKAAGIAVQALKGLGVYQQDASVQINLESWLSNIPEKAKRLLELETDRSPGVPDGGPLENPREG